MTTANPGDTAFHGCGALHAVALADRATGRRRALESVRFWHN